MSSISTRAIMVLGTASHAGKSVVTAALCRTLSNRGVRVAPFKAQNMSLNSAATDDEREIGRAQHFQAECARVAASSDMNPVLLKPTSHTSSQVIVNGKIWKDVTAGAFLGELKHDLWHEVCSAYDRLAAQYDVIVIEGAGSPAEINLRAHDIVNMPMAHYADAGAVLLADIDRGGAFAAVAGTWGLLSADDRARIGCYAFTKFRGDARLLDDGIEMLRGHVPIPCAGIIPWFDTTGLDEEDGVSLERKRALRAPWPQDATLLRIGVLAFPRISNFTDFEAFAEEPSVALRYVDSVALAREAHVLILPGTKSTAADLKWLRDHGFDGLLRSVPWRQNRCVVGICGGMQMLGERIDDPLGVEGGETTTGLGLLPLQSVMAANKVTRNVRAQSSAFGETLAFTGYEIHCGQTTFGDESSPFAHVETSSGRVERDGIRTESIAATYLHDLFRSDAVRHAFLRDARARAGLPAATEYAPVAATRDSRIERMAAIVEAAMPLDRVLDACSAAADCGYRF